MQVLAVFLFLIFLLLSAFGPFLIIKAFLFSKNRDRKDVRCYLISGIKITFFMGVGWYFLYNFSLQSECAKTKNPTANTIGFLTSFNYFYFRLAIAES